MPFGNRDVWTWLADKIWNSEQGCGCTFGLRVCCLLLIGINVSQDRILQNFCGTYWIRLLSPSWQVSGVSAPHPLAQLLEYSVTHHSFSPLLFTVVCPCLFLRLFPVYIPDISLSCAPQFFVSWHHPRIRLIRLASSFQQQRDSHLGNSDIVILLWITVYQAPTLGWWSTLFRCAICIILFFKLCNCRRIQELWTMLQPSHFISQGILKLQVGFPWD